MPEQEGKEEEREQAVEVEVGLEEAGVREVVVVVVEVPVLVLWALGRECSPTAALARPSLDSNPRDSWYCSTSSRARCLVIKSAGLAVPLTLTNSTAFLRACSWIQRAPTSK